MGKPRQASPGGNRRTKISAALAKGEDKSNRHWRAIFIGALAETSNVTAAAAAAGVHPSRPYKVRRLEPGFAREWHRALCEGYDNLELELLHRLRRGEARDDERRFDNGAALRLLGQHRDTVARERAMQDNEDADTVRASIEAKLARLRAQVVARRRQQAESEPDA